MTLGFRYSQIMAQEPCHAPAHYLRLLKSHNPHLARPEQDRRCRLPSRKQADRADRGWAATDPDPRNPRQKSTESQALRLEALDDGGDGGDGAEVSRTASQASHKSGAFDSRIAAAVGLSELTATEQCPHCSRRFSREAAARHVPICAGLKSRPKPPKEHMVYFTDQLGRRQASPNGQGDTGFSVASYNRSRPRMVWPQSPEVESSSLNTEISGIGTLKQQWSLVQFLLRDGLEALADDSTILATARTAEGCMEFLDILDDYSVKLGMRKGALSRLLLPFNSDTDSGDQANSAVDAPLGSRELDGLMTDRERQDLVQRAVALRRLVRVKVADCADIEQARESLKLIVEFLDGLQKAAAQEKRSLTSILREL